ncbi:TolC family protein [Curvibacter sp. PAE-UM]|uniref:TolC family protein n=1 Tax=Curvibacter sp. PAE-UM TaxID=1714344 RepID=UPI0009E9CB05|nr:TolC family protein [Curvibacter sp. PAE-UM]
MLILMSRTFFAILLVAFGQAVQASDALIDAFEQARKFDPLFQAARSERDANLAASQVAGSAYYPQLQGSYTQLETEANTRQTYTLTQPVISAERYATLQEREPREQLASATFQLREQDLSQRLVKAVAELLRANEGLRLNKAKIDALEKQSQSAQRAFELGQGTVTDVRDARVRLDQARADTLTLEAQTGAAQRQLTAITGAPVASLLLSVPRMERAVALQSLDEYIASGVQANPQLVVAQQNQRIGELAVTRADSAWLPTLSAVWMNTTSNHVTTNYSGISVSLPLQAGSFYQMKGAAANALKTQEQTRDAELRTRLEVQRLWALVNAGRSEVAIRLEAINSAELSVEANEKSFRGGVRSQIDVLSSIQILYQVQQDYVNAVLTLAENYLNLLLQAAIPADQAIASTQAILFPTR